MPAHPDGDGAADGSFSGPAGAVDSDDGRTRHLSRERGSRGLDVQAHRARKLNKTGERGRHVGHIENFDLAFGPEAGYGKGHGYAVVTATVHGATLEPASTP